MLAVAVCAPAFLVVFLVAPAHTLLHADHHCALCLAGSNGAATSPPPLSSPGLAMGDFLPAWSPVWPGATPLSEPSSRGPPLR